MILNDKQIRARCNPTQFLNRPMIQPFCEKQVAEGQISYGLSSFGYDIRCSDEFMIFSNALSATVDPKAFNEDAFIEAKGDCVTIPPNSFALTSSVEYFYMPSDVMAMCIGKSTYARCGIIINVTPIEPGWHGIITIEISNTTPLPAKIYANEGIAQLLFFEGKRCETSYADRDGKYLGQTGITLPRLKN